MQRLAAFGERPRDRQGLPHAAGNAALLREHQHGHHEPVPQQPVDPETGAGDGIETIERGLPPGDGITPKLDLCENLDDTANQNQPQQPESSLSADFGCGDQFARTDDGSRDDYARPQVAQGCGKRAWRAPDAILNWRLAQL